MWSRIKFGVLAGGAGIALSAGTVSAQAAPAPAMPAGESIASNFNSVLTDHAGTTFKATTVLVGIGLIRKYIFRAGSML